MEIIVVLFGMFLMFLIYVYAENNLLIMKRYILKKGQNPQRKLKIVQISDVHKKRIGKKIISRTRQAEADIILLTGDLVSRHETNFSYLEKMVEGLAKICPVYACIGNHEQDLPCEYMEQYRAIMKKYGVHLLENNTDIFEADSISIKIAGASLRHGIYKNPDGGYSNLESCTADDLVSDLGRKDGFTILLAHNPLCFEAYCGWGADFVFSGHIHGGSVRLPFLGGILSPERRFFPEYSKGVYRKKATTMVVSGGIGKPRIFNPPEIVCCEINF